MKRIQKADLLTYCWYSCHSSCFCVVMHFLQRSHHRALRSVVIEIVFLCKLTVVRLLEKQLLPAVLSEKKLSRDQWRKGIRQIKWRRSGQSVTASD